MRSLGDGFVSTEHSAELVHQNSLKTHRLFSQPTYPFNSDDTTLLRQYKYAFEYSHLRGHSSQAGTEDDRVRDGDKKRDDYNKTDHDKKTDDLASLALVLSNKKMEAEKTLSTAHTSKGIIRRGRSKLPEPTWHAPWRLMRVISGHTGWVRSVAVDASNRWFATGSVDRTIKVLVLFYDE